MLGRHQAQIGHQLRGVGKALQIADLGHRDRRRQQLHPAQRHQRLDHRPHRRRVCRLVDLLVQRRHPRAAMGDAIDVFLHHDLLARVIELHRLQPAKVRLRPVILAFKAPPMPEQERQQPLPGAAFQVLQITPCARQIAQRFVLAVRYPHRRQFARAVQPGQHQAVAPVGLDPVAGLLRNQRGCHHLAGVSQRLQLAHQPVATGSGFVHKRQRAPAFLQYAYQLHHRLGRIGNLAHKTHFTTVRVRHGNCNQLLVHIQPNILDKLVHDLSPQFRL